jgi:hypothetical protein
VGGHWQELGPRAIDSNVNGNSAFHTGLVSGRVTSLAVDPADPKIVYLGSAGGGVWKTMNSGESWQVLTDSADTTAIGAVAIDPSDSRILYAATGEGNHCPNVCPPSLGVLKSVDRGRHWSLLGNSTFDTNPFTFMPSIAVDRTNGDRVFAATTRGLFVSSDGGETWARNDQLVAVTTSARPFIKPSGGVDVIQQDPVNPNKWWAAISDNCNTEAGSIAQSTDRGNTWTEVTYFPFFAPVASRLSLSVGPNGIAYVGFSACDYFYHGVQYYVYGQALVPARTLDGGRTWDYLSFRHTGATGLFDWMYPQGWYDNTVLVDPTNSDRIMFGGVRLMVTLDGGKTFRRAGGVFDFPQEGVHADQHALAFVPSSGGAVYLGNDGGVWKTSDFGALGSVADWTNLNATLNLTTFYAGDALDLHHVAGGTQDDGTPVLVSNDKRAPWPMVMGGDGGWTAFDPTPGSTRLYGEFPYGLMRRVDYTNQSHDWAGPCGLVVGEHSPACDDPVEPIPPFVMDPSNPQRLYFGTNRIWRTQTGGVPAGTASWAPISGPMGRTFDDIATMATGAGATAGTLIAATFFGSVYLSSNAESTTPLFTNVTGNLPVRTTANRILSNPWVPQLAVNPRDSREIWLVLGTPVLGRVWHTTNAGDPGGTVWTDISGEAGTLSASLLKSIAVDPASPGTIYVGSDHGVFRCQSCGGSDAAGNWVRFGDALPNVRVQFLRVTADGTSLVAFTHGRGAWAIRLDE